MSSNHSQDILLKLNNDRKSSAKYCDISLVVDDYRYPAHKCVLGLLSPFFDKLFGSKGKTRKNNEVVIRGISKEVFEAILDFIYTGSIALTMENVFEMVEAANQINLPYLEEFCITYLGNEINAKNWLSVQTYGKRCGYKDLLKKVDEAISKKFDSVMTASNFVELDIEELKHLLGLEEKSVESEEKLYESVIGWIKHDRFEREIYAKELLDFINFSEMSLEFLNQVVAKEKLIEDSHETLKAVFRAIRSYKSPAPKQPEEVYNSATSDGESTTSSRSCLALLDDFVAVDSENVWRFTSNGLRRTRLDYNHAGGSAVQWNSTVFVISGSETRETEAIDVSGWALPFSSISCCPTNYFRYAAAAVIHENRLYITGGLSSETSSEFCETKHTEFYSGYVWTNFERMNFSRHGHALASLLNAVYVVGGNVSPNQSFLRYDICSKRTVVLPRMNYLRLHLATVDLKQEIYAIGGMYNGVVSGKVEKFNPLNNNWKTVASLNFERYRPGACVLGGQIIVVGGGSSAVEVYDDKEDLWKIVGEYETLKDVFAVFPLHFRFPFECTLT